MSDYEGPEGVCLPADIEKDPDDTVLVRFNWASRLKGETISTSDFLLPDGLTEGTNSGSGSYRATLVSGGTEGNKYRVTNRITTSGARQLDMTRTVLVRAA